MPPNDPAQRPGARDAWIGTVTLSPGSLQRIEEYGSYLDVNNLQTQKAVQSKKPIVKKTQTEFWNSMPCCKNRTSACSAVNVSESAVSNWTKETPKPARHKNASKM